MNKDSKLDLVKDAWVAMTVVAIVLMIVFFDTSMDYCTALTFFCPPKFVLVWAVIIFCWTIASLFLRAWHKTIKEGRQPKKFFSSAGVIILLIVAYIVLSWIGDTIMGSF